MAVTGANALREPGALRGPVEGNTNTLCRIGNWSMTSSVPLLYSLPSTTCLRFKTFFSFFNRSSKLLLLFHSFANLQQIPSWAVAAHSIETRSSHSSFLAHWYEADSIHIHSPLLSAWPWTDLSRLLAYAVVISGVHPSSFMAQPTVVCS